MKSLFLRTARFVLLKLNILIELVNYFILDGLFVINGRLKTNDIGNSPAKAADVIEEAKKHSEKPAFEQRERDFIYYYYLMKHYTAVYEAYFGLVPPIQVFNEHRMALDHIIRAKETDDPENTSKATDHALRGLLDVLKLNCAGLKTKIQKEHKKYPPKALGLVSDGDYIKNFAELQNNAENRIYEAKRDDYHLEESGRRKIEVANKFIHAFDAHVEWLQFQQQHWGKIIKGYAKYRIAGIGYFLLVAGTSIITGVIACWVWGARAELTAQFWAWLNDLWVP